jgi:hypothetical protein
MVAGIGHGNGQPASQSSPYVKGVCFQCIPAFSEPHGFVRP